MKYVDMDGSALEGGGSIVRLASALSVMTGKPLRIYNIRKGRDQPGLRTQHLRGLEAIASLCNGRLEGAKIGATEIFFYPGKVTQNNVKITIETAGSVGLAIQSLMMACLKAKEQVTIDIEGGATFGKYAPPLQYTQFVLLPLLRRMGYHCEINIIRHGFYPAGGAQVKVMIDPPEKLEPIVMEDAGNMTTVDVISTASLSLKKPRVGERQVREAELMLKKRGFVAKTKTCYSESICPGSGVVLVGRTSGGCIVGADGLGERGKPAEEVSVEAVNSILRTAESSSSVDEYMSDQLLPYMAMAPGRSSITAPVLTSHAETNIHVLEKFLDVKFDVSQQNGNVKIECSS